MSALRPLAARVSGLLATSAVLSAGLIPATPAAPLTQVGWRFAVRRPGLEDLIGLKGREKAGSPLGAPAEA
ncbi:hypothetical protein ACFY15_30075 [Streptomyces sp. NPDC001373]|uniref:hypothetical protein n=1 Tax=Streptomyces sp. NPDC001373 TaxID=3364565 RepID=UPI0036AB9A5C